MAFASKYTLLGGATPLPLDTGDTPGYPAGTKFPNDGEDGEAAVLNRGLGALADNTDDLDTRMNRDIGLPEVGILATFTGNSIVIDPSGGAAGDVNYTGTLYLGESGWTGQERLDQLFQLLDENYNEVTVDGNEVKVTSLTGNSLGDEFVATATTLNLNETLPSGNYRIGYYSGTTLSELPAYAFTHAGLRGLQESPGEDKTGYTLVFSDGTNSTGGHYNTPTGIEVLGSLPYGGQFLLKRGNYESGTAVVLYGTLRGETPVFGATFPDDLTSVMIPATASADVYFGDKCENIILGSKHATYQYIAAATSLENVDLAPGSTKVMADLHWKGGTVVTKPPGSAATAGYGILFTGNARGIIEGVRFDGSGDETPGLNPSVKIDAITPSAGQWKSLLFRDCQFYSTYGNAVEIGDADIHITFENCNFYGDDGVEPILVAGPAYNTKIRFVNCSFYNAFGVFSSASTRPCYFEGCMFYAGSSVPGSFGTLFYLAAGGMEDCTFELNAASISDANTQALVELGDGGGGVVARNVRIDCPKVGGGNVLKLHGGTGDNVSAYDDITLDIPAAPTVDRGAGSGLISIEGASAAEAQKCACRNIQVLNVTSDTVTDNGSAVYCSYAVIDGLLVDGAGSSTGSYKYGVEAAGSTIRGLDYCPGNTIRCATNQIKAGVETTLSKGAIHKILSTTGTQAIIDLGLKARVINMNCPSIETSAAGDYLLAGGSGAHFCVVEGNTFVFNVSNPTNTAARCIWVLGDLARVNSNTVWITRSTADAVTTTASGLIDSNIVDYNSGGATPTVNGGTAGTNVLTP